MSLPQRIEGLRARIQRACEVSGRDPATVELLPVSKKQPLSLIREAMGLGFTRFGENYVQEGLTKIAALEELDLEWHFIGPLQSNKTRPVAEHFAWVHGIERLKIAERLSQARGAQRPPLQVCVQVNVSGEASKSGVSPGETAALAHAVAVLPNLRLRGLMAIPEPTADTALARRRFAALRELRDALNKTGLALDTLSMGMSLDLEAAILEGATIVRVGTAIFGERA